MKFTNIVVGVATVAALLTVEACSQTSTEQSGPALPSNSAVAQTHNHVDAMFAQHMIAHHQQAIEMSDMVLEKQGIDPRVTNLAKQIKDAQSPEIEQMKGWLTAWGISTSKPGMDMPGHSMPSGSMMPGMGMGMMSDADMAALQNSQGVEASKVFLTQMVSHHQGAIAMAQHEIKKGQYPAALDLAKSIAASQQKEIDTMNSILASL